MPQAEYHRLCDLRAAAEYAFSQHEGEGMAHDLDDAVHGAAAVLRGHLEAHYGPQKAGQLLGEILAALPALSEGEGASDHPAAAMGRLLHEALRDEQGPGRWGF